MHAFKQMQEENKIVRHPVQSCCGSRSSTIISHSVGWFSRTEMMRKPKNHHEPLCLLCSLPSTEDQQPPLPQDSAGHFSIKPKQKASGSHNCIPQRWDWNIYFLRVEFILFWDVLLKSAKIWHTHTWNIITNNLGQSINQSIDLSAGICTVRFTT